MKIVKILVVVMLTLFFRIGFVGATGLVRTSSNTLLFTEDFDDTTYIDSSSYYSYTFRNSGGYVSQQSHLTWDWDGPLADIEYSKDGSGVYIIYEKYNDVPASGYGMRPDVFLYKIDENGTSLWTRSIWVRKKTNVEWGGSRYPSLTTDGSGNVYVVWIDYDTQRYVAMQKFDSAGIPQWNNGVEIKALTNIYAYQSPRCVYYNGYVYVVAKYNANQRLLHLQKVNAATGNLEFSNPVVVNADTSTSVYNPDIKTGGTNIYVVWSRNFNDVYAQRLSRVDGARDFAQDVKVNTNSGYYYKYFWYGNREDDVVMDIDDNTNVFIAWSSGDINSEQQIYLQKLDKDLNRQWTNDIKVPDVNETAAAYPAIAVEPGGAAVYVSWISHRNGYNDYGYLQKISGIDGSIQWGSDLNMRNNYGYYHGGRIDFYNGWVYTTGVAGRFQRFNNNGDRFFNGTKIFYDRGYFVRTKYDSLTVLPGVVLQARIKETSVTKNPTGAKVLYRFAGDGNNWSSYVEPSNGEIEITLTSNVGNDFRYGALLDSKTDVDTNEWGMDRCIMYQIQVEATKLYLGDWSVSPYDTGSAAVGNLVLNLSAENQSVLKYVYNTGNNSTFGYFLLRNNGNITTNFKITGTKSSADWGVEYYTAIYSGGKWITNENITSQVTNSGYVASNVTPYNSQSDLVGIIAKVTPSVSLVENDSYVINLEVDAQSGATYYPHDVASINAVVKNYKPDLQVGIVTNSGSVSDYEGDSIYNSTGDLQDKFQKADTNVTAVYFVKIENDGKQDTIKVTGTAGDANWNVKYYTELDGGTDITADITGGGHYFLLNALAYTQIRVEVTPINPSIGTEYDLLVTGVSTNNTGEVDTVKLTTRRVESKVDILVKRDSDSSYTGDNIYNTNANNQSLTNIADNGMTNIFYYQVYNEGSEAMDIIVNADFNKSLSSGWNVELYYNSQNITSQITNFYVFSNLAVGGYETIMVKIAPPAGFSIGANEIMDSFLWGRSEAAMYKYQKTDKNKIFTKCISSREDLIAVNSTNLYIGRNIITNSYVNQNSFEFINHLITNNYQFIVTNTSPSPYKVRLTKTVENDTGWLISFTHSGSNIDSYLTTGWTTPEIPAYGKEIINVLVHPTASVSADVTNKITLNAVSLINSQDVDVIRFSTSRIFPPDLLVKKTNQVSYGGDDEYGTNIASQASGGSISTNVIIQGNTNDYWYLVKVQNDRILPESTVLYGTESDTNFMITYWKYIGTNIDSPEIGDNGKWTEITGEITRTTGYTLNNLNGGTNVLFRVGARVTNTNIQEGDSIQTIVRAVGLAADYIDMIRLYTTYGIARPDLIIRTNWDNVYEVSNSSIQIITNIVDKATGTIVDFVVQNESSLNKGTFLIKGQNDIDDWILKYYDKTSDVSDNVKSGSGYTKIMDTLTSSTLQMRILVNTNSTYTNGYTYTMFLSVEPEDSANLKDMGKIITIITDKGKVDISLTNGEWNNFYEVTVSSQVYKYIDVERGYTNSFLFCIGNDRSDANEMIRFTGDGNAGSYSIKYYWYHNSSWSNVTSECIGSGFKPHINNNSIATMKFEVYVDTNVLVGDEQAFNIHLKSQGQLEEDNAVLWVKVVDKGTPDLSFTNGSWNDLYENNTPVVQITNFTIEKGYTNFYYLYVGNDKATSERLSLTGIGDYGDFNIKYILVTNGTTNDISQDVTNAGAPIYINGLSRGLLIVTVSLLSNSNYTMDSNFNINMKLYSQAKSVNDAVRLVVSVTDKGIPDLGYSETNYNYKFTNVLYPTLQQTNIWVEKGISKIDYILLKNGLNWRDETFRFVGEKISSSGWELSCYDMAYADVKYFTNNNYYTISANSSKTLLLQMLVDEDSLVSGSRTTSFTLESHGELKKDVLSLTYTITDRGDPDLVYANGMKGDGDKEPTYPPSSQVYTNLIEKGETYAQIIYLQNDNSDRGEKLRFTGGGSKGDFTVVYQYWTNSGWKTINTNRKIYVSNNSTATLKMQVTLAAGSTYGTNVQYNFDLNLTSMGRQVEDNMIIWYKVADKGRPNIAFTNGNWTNYVEATPIFQYTNSRIEKGYTNSYYFNLWNNRTNRSETFTLKGVNNNVGEFNVKYFIITNAVTSDITTSVLGTGFAVSVKSNDKVGMILKIGLPSSSSHELQYTTTNFTYLYSENGFARDAIKILSIVTDYGKPDLIMDNNFNDIYYPVAQSTNIFIEKGFLFTNYIYLNNDLTGIRSYEKYNLKGGADTGDWNLSYYFLTNTVFTDISSAVAGPSGRDFYVDANSSVTLAQVVYVPNGSSYGYGENYSFTNILLSQGELIQDRLSFVYTITSFAQPDLSVTNGLGTNVYETTTVLTQNYTNIVEKGLTNYITFICGNDNPVRSEDLRFIGNKSTNDFTLSYYFYKNGIWTNVTIDATNQIDGFSFFVPNNSIKTMRMGIYLDIASSYNTNTFHPFDVRLKSQGKLKQDHFIVYGKVVDRGKPDISFTNGDWNNLYDYVANESFPPSFQYTNFYVEKGYTNNIYLNLGNDRTDGHYEYMRFKAASNNNEFIVTYTTNGKDITSAVTSSTGVLLYISSANDLRLVASVSLLSNSDNDFGTGFNITPILKSMGRAYMEKASIVVSTTDYGRPDLYTDGEFNDVYSPTAQTTNIIAEKGFTITNYIYLNNDLNSIRSFERYYFKTKSGTGEWHLTYYFKTNGSFVDVTADVTNERKFYVPANSTYTLSAVMKIDTNCSYAMGTSLNTSMTLISQGKLVKDKMSFVYFITDTGKPDITLTNAGSVWSTVYEDSGSVSVQIYTNNIELKKTNNFYFYVENDNTTRGETLRFQGDKSGISYDLKYYRVTAGGLIDITSYATNPNEYDVYIPNNSKITMIAQCYIGSNSGLSTNAIFDVKLNITSQGRFKTDNAIIRYVVVDNGKPDIAFTNGVWNNKYYPTNIQQTNFYVEPRKTNVLILNLQNDKYESEILHLKANIGNNIFTVKYFTNNIDITANITNANGYNISFAAYSTQQLEINVTINTGVNYSFGTNMDLQIELQSEARFKKDLITLNAYVTDFGIPDCKITNNDFNNEYYPTNQTYAIPIERGIVRTNFVLVENDNPNRNEKFLVTVDKPNTNMWNLQVYYLTNGSEVNISSAVFSNGRNIEIGNNSTATLKTVMLYKITMTNIYYSNAYTFLDVDVFSAARLKKDVLTLNYAITDKGVPDIMTASGKYSNVYTWITPTSQISNYIFEKGETNTFKFILENDRTNSPEYMSLKIDDFVSSGWFIKVEIYSNNVWSDVTADVTNYGAYFSLPANTSMSMRMRMGVRADNTNTYAFTNKVQIKLYSQTHIKYDRILLNSILSIPQPDLMVKTEVGSLVGENQYTNNLNFTNGQFVVGRAFYGYRLQFNLRLQNENAIDDTLVLYYKIVSTNHKWKFDVYELNLTAGTNTNAGLIARTTYLANTNNSGYNLTPGGTKDFLIRVEMADKDVDVSEVFRLVFYAKSKDNPLKMDVAGIEVIRQPVAVSGKVVYKQTGQSIPGATFTIYDASGENQKVYIADSNGVVSFEYLPGTYSIKVKADDYIEYEGEISIEDAETYDFGSIELLKYNVDINSLNIHAFPNPIAEGQTIRLVYNIPQDDTVTIEIYDVMGRVIRVIKDEESVSKGRYTYLWDGLDDSGKRVKRGVYFLVISTGSDNSKVKIFIK